MGRPLSKLAELDAATPAINSLTADATYLFEEGARLFAKIESSSTDSGRTTFEISAGMLEGRERNVSYAWRSRGRKLSTLLNALVKAFPIAGLPPSHFQLSSRSSQLAPAMVRQLILEALAEAGGYEPSPAEPPSDKTKGGAVNWFSTLREREDGPKQWNRLKASERKEIDLSSIDLSGLDLTGLKLRGVTAKRASFVGAQLRRAELAEGSFDWSDFSSADLESARLKGVRAPETVFRGTRLAGADLSRGLFFKASFVEANLSGADLSDANLLGADLRGADLEGAKLLGVSFDLRTEWPAGFAIPPEAIFVGKGTDPRLVGKGKKAVAIDLGGLVARLRSTIDPKRMNRTFDMLKRGRNQLYAEVEPTFVRGVVRSQTEENLVYGCVLIDDGTYACCTPDFAPCLGLRGEPCKHILVLLIGLARAGLLDPAAVDPWIVAAKGKNDRRNATTRSHLIDTFLRYKGSQAGEVDWRPTETIPEDFYVL